MSKFNAKKTVSSQITTNFAGGEAFKESNKLELVSLLLTSFAQNSFYQKEEQTNNRLIDLISNNRPDFVAKSAIFARNEFGMRSISHITAAELAKYLSSVPWAKNFYNKIVRRPDDMMEILAYYTGKGNKITNSMKKGFAEAMSRFDSYQLGKYRGEGKDFKLVDIANLVHPVPTEGEKYMVDVDRKEYIEILSKKISLKKKGDKKELETKLNWAKSQEGETIKIHALEALVIDLLRSKDTVASELSKAGQKANSSVEKEDLKKDVWVKLLSERKIGYMSLLMNLRNIVEQAPEMIDVACELLTDKKLIKNSLVLPFRYLVAYNELSNLGASNSKFRKVLTAINEAAEIALDNIPKFDGETLVVLDTSGSMTGARLAKSQITCAQAGAQFAAAIAKRNGCDLMRFDDNAQYLNYNQADSLMTITNVYKFASAGTNFHSIFKTANKAYDRIIILSDMAGWVGGNAPTSTFREYCRKYNCQPHIYSFDLQGYGTLQFPENKVYAMAGFSDKVFELMTLLEKDRQSLINQIEKIEL